MRDGDGDAFGAGDRDGGGGNSGIREREELGLAKCGPAHDGEIGRVDGWAAGLEPEPSRCFLGGDSAPELVGAMALGRHGSKHSGSLVRAELDLLEHVAPDGPAHVGGGLEPDRLGGACRTVPLGP